MTPSERIQPHITAAYRTWSGLKAEPLDLKAAFSESADLAYAKAEIDRIRGSRGDKTVFEACHESKIRCQTLDRMVAEYEAGGT